MMGLDESGRPPFDVLVGTQYLSDDPDQARAQIEVRNDHRQPYGLVHGGVFSTVVESLCSRATGLQVASEAMVAIGQSLDISFLRPVSEGRVAVTARARHRGRSTWVW